MAEYMRDPRPGSAGHAHPEGEAEMEPGALREHLRKHHGWTEAMFGMGRATDSYIRSWHRGDHVPLARPKRP